MPGEKEYVLSIRFYGVPSEDHLDEVADQLMELLGDGVDGIQYDLEGQIETVEYEGGS